MKNTLATPIGALLFAVATCALAAPSADVPGQKLDSGLGSLPHYRSWADPSGRAIAARHVAGESLDDGVGQLPPYSQWKDPSGKDPLGQQPLRVSVSTRN